MPFVLPSIDISDALQPHVAFKFSAIVLFWIRAVIIHLTMI